jgi:hypothetical protein
MWIIGLILTIIYIVWLNRLIKFGIVTATRIAVASEISAANLAVLVQALSPEAMERVLAAQAVAAAPQQAAKQQATRQGYVSPETPSMNNDSKAPYYIFGIIAGLFLLLILASYLPHGS